MTQGSNNSLAVTVSMQQQTGYKSYGPADAFNPVNHNDDIIWLWLNPLLNLKVNPDIPNSVQWNGYGFDATDYYALDVYPVYVNELKYGLSPETQTELARVWAAGQNWPSGDGPALTLADYSNILQADPFTNSEYTLPEILPSTTPDGRFTLAGSTQGATYNVFYTQE